MLEETQGHNYPGQIKQEKTEIIILDITEAQAESVSQSDRQTYRKTHRHKERQTNIQKDRQTENV